MMGVKGGGEFIKTDAIAVGTEESRVIVAARGKS